MYLKKLKEYKMLKCYIKYRGKPVVEDAMGQTFCSDFP